MIAHRLEGVTSLEPRVSADFCRRTERYRRAVNPADVDALASSLGVAADALRRLGVGRVGRAWTFPMVDGRHRVCGFMRLFPSGEMGLKAGSRLGVFVPTDIRPGTPIVVCVGPLDVAALLTLGIESVGRPGSVDDDRLLKPYCRARRIAIVVDDSRQDDAARLSDALRATCQSVRTVTLPTGFPSVHAWLRAGALRSDLIGLIRSAAPMVASEADGGRLVA